MIPSMIISIVGSKGGQGKSTITSALAFGCAGAVLTNDIDGSIDEYLPEHRYLKLSNNDSIPDLPNEGVFIFDGKAGIDEPVVIDAIKKSDFIIIPTVYGVEEFKRAVRAIREIEAVGKGSQLLVVANRAKKNEWQDLKQALLSQDPPITVPVFWIRESKFVAELLFQEQSIHQKSLKSKLHEYQMKDLCEQFEALFNHLGVKRLA